MCINIYDWIHFDPGKAQPVFADNAKQPVNKLIQLKYVHLLKVGASVELIPDSECSAQNTNGYYKCITKYYRNLAHYTLLSKFKA